MRSCLISQPCSCLQSAPHSLKFSHSLPADRNNWTIDNHSCGMPPNCKAFNYMGVYESLSLCFNRKNKRRRSDRESKKTEATDVDMLRHPTFHPDHEEFVLVRFLSALFYSKKLWAGIFGLVVSAAFMWGQVFKKQKAQVEMVYSACFFHLFWF